MKGSEQYAAIILVIILRLIRTTRNQGIRQQRQQYPCILSTAKTTSVHTFNSNNSIIAYSQQQQHHCILSTAAASLHTPNSNSILPYSQQQQQNSDTWPRISVKICTMEDD